MAKFMNINGNYKTIKIGDNFNVFSWKQTQLLNVQLKSVGVIYHLLSQPTSPTGMKINIFLFYSLQKINSHLLLLVI